MDLIRKETVDESIYWCQFGNGTIGLVMFPNDEVCVPREYNIGLDELNSTFHTNFSEKEFIESIQQLGVKEFSNIVETLIQYSTTPQITIIKGTRLIHELFGSIVDIDESLINTSKNGAGYDTRCSAYAA